MVSAFVLSGLEHPLINIQAGVYTSGASSEDIAEQWLASYNKNNQKALTDFINFVFRSAGCSSEVTIDDINDPDNAETRISDMQDVLQAVSSVHFRCKEGD